MIKFVHGIFGQTGYQIGTLTSALGHPSEPPLSIAQALVRHPQLRRGGAASLREGALPARQVFRGPGANRRALRNLQQCQGKLRIHVTRLKNRLISLVLSSSGRTGVLSLDWQRRAEPDAPLHNQLFGQTAHGARLRQREVCHSVLRLRPERQRRRH